MPGQKLKKEKKVLSQVLLKHVFRLFMSCSLGLASSSGVIPGEQSIHGVEEARSAEPVGTPFKSIVRVVELALHFFALFREETPPSQEGVGQERTSTERLLPNKNSSLGVLVPVQSVASANQDRPPLVGESRKFE